MDVKDPLPVRVGFSFSKTAASGVRKKRETPEPDRDYVTNISGNHLTSLLPIKSSGPLVIPLETQGSTKKMKAVSDKPLISLYNHTVSDHEKTLDELAAEALILEARNEQQTLNSDKILPIILQNQIEGIEHILDEEERFKYDVQSRPDEADEDAYEQVPIDEFGKAMLRGMGWESGKPIGLNNRGLVEPIEFVARQGRLGLGATPEMIEVKKKKYIKPGESREPKPVMVAPTGPDGKVRHVKRIGEKLVPLNRGIIGKLAAIASGPHEGLYARVLQECPNEEVVVRLLVSDEDVVVSKSDLNLSVTERTLPNHPALKKHKKSGNEHTHSKSKSQDTDSSKTWLCPHIMVRIISKKVGGGKYYNKKGHIVDVVGRHECTIQLLDGVLVDGIRQSGLETVIPKPGGKVMVVNGSSKGVLGSLVERKKQNDRESALIQLAGDLSFGTYDLDDIAEYVAPHGGEI